MRVEIGVKGMEKLSKELDKLGIDINKSIIQGLTKSAIKVEGEAKKLCIVDTGRLRSSITHEINISSKNEVTARVGTNVDYACVYGAKTPVYDPVKKVSYGIGHYKSNYVLSKDGKNHKIDKFHRFYQKEIDLIKIIAHNRRNPILVTDKHLILILRDNSLIWIEAKEMKNTDKIFTKRGHNVIMDNSNKKEYTCICGNNFFVYSYVLKYRLPKYCSIKCRHLYGRHDMAKGKSWQLTEEQRMKKRGENNSQWKGGISEQKYDWRFNDKLKLEVKKRDDCKCSICKNTDDLIIHHKDSNKMNSDIDNLITLCRKCHCYVTYGKLSCELPIVNLDIFKPIPIKKIEYIKIKRNGKTNIGRLYDFTINNENSFYAGGILIHNSYIEFGTRRHLAPVGVWGKRHGFGKATWLWVSGRAKPFLYPALQKSISFIRNQLKQEININLSRG